MSITLYSGTPGSGKSYHAARDIVARLKQGGGLITNFAVNTDAVRRCKSRVDCWDNRELTVTHLYEYAAEHHKLCGKEGQTLVVIDECQLMFNSRDWQRGDRMSWLQFFSQHRKCGFDILLIAQSDRMLDRSFAQSLRRKSAIAS